MRRSILIASALVTTLALSACGSSEDAGDTTEGTEESTAEATEATGSLTVWVDETRETAVESAAEAFESETGAEVEIVLKNFEDIRSDFIAQVPTGEGPDVTVGAHDWLGELITNGVVAPVELGATADGFEDVAVEAFTADGAVYGMPYAIENIALIRNTELADSAPATWDDAISMGEDADTKYPFLIQTGTEGDPYTYYPFQTSFGAPVFEQNEDGSYSPELAMGGDAGTAYAQWLAEQGEAGTLTTDITYDIAVEAFAKGQSPFIVGGPWMLEQFADLDLAIDPIPAAGDEAAQPFVGVQGFYVSAQSENALLANDFLVNYLSTEEAQTALFEAGGRPPALTAAADAASSDPIVAGFREVGAEAVPMPSIPEMGSVWAFWGVTEANIIAGKADPAKAWDKMISDIEGALDS
ncbi:MULTISPECIES: maltose ABC transporter substrate-binding protein [unclassified Isoptericola]|uniref:sugar ABC transporter substrate-binding protein n=1 Tax=unclassified Isoptericola TaxID=2623355 RepID=UPI0027134FE5|nr:MULTISPECIES: maltose ABC transporter substrate-binding protein [unclassified Isoptericola]MDO8145315.1 maltose ABC transporter substrate-binding protein [Isoptericola sp. 178]MDO8151104.1 maltose ABC transporter substrate-binding protein [Isoptericola sp. b408]